jgi:hypothetical protein
MTNLYNLTKEERKLSEPLALAFFSSSPEKQKAIADLLVPGQRVALRTVLLKGFSSFDIALDPPFDVEQAALAAVKAGRSAAISAGRKASIDGKKAASDGDGSTSPAPEGEAPDQLAQTPMGNTPAAEPEAELSRTVGVLPAHKPVIPPVLTGGDRTISAGPPRPAPDLSADLVPPRNGAVALSGKPEPRTSAEDPVTAPRPAPGTPVFRLPPPVEPPVPRHDARAGAARPDSAGVPAPDRTVERPAGNPDAAQFDMQRWRRAAPTSASRDTDGSQS